MAKKNSRALPSPCSATCFCGIDVSKKHLDAHLRFGTDGRSRRFANSSQGWKELLAWALLLADGPVHFCLESTGTYGLGIASFLADSGEFVSVVNPRFVKHFAVGARLQNKTDRSDARVIAEYCRLMRPLLWELRDPRLRELDLLLRRLDDLDSLEGQERNRLEQAGLPDFVYDSVTRLLGEIRAERLLVLLEIRKAQEALPEVRAMVMALVPEPGIGELTALRVLSAFGYDPDRFESAEQAAASTGLNPVRKESGTFVGKSRTSKCGNADFRGNLYMSALAAIQYNDAVRDRYLSLVERGKLKRVALVAAMRKLVMLCHGILTRFVWGIPPVYNGDKTRYLDLFGKQKRIPDLTS